MNREILEAQLSELPLYQYAFVKTEDILFSDRIRWICEHECTMYNKTWACPPAVGSVEDRNSREQEAILPLTEKRMLCKVRYTTRFDKHGKPVKAYGSAIPV